MFCLTYCVTELACQSQTKQSMVDILIQNKGLQWVQYDMTTTRRPMVSLCTQFTAIKFNRKP